MDCSNPLNITLPKDFGEDVARLTEAEQHMVLTLKQVECICQMNSKPVTLNGTYCQRAWDNLMCWDDSPAGRVVHKPCPGYINNFNIHKQASRTCLENGTWFTPPGRNALYGWTNYTLCLSNGTDVTDRFTTTDVPNIFSVHLDNIRIMCDIGYGISLVSLLFACIIMIFFRRLHCSRNTIHLNLFASFILRAATSLIRDTFMVGGLGFPGDVSFNKSGGAIVFNEGVHWECRLFFSVFYYAVAASYTWIFMEAVYLHMLIFVTVFAEKMRIVWFMLIGWLFPALIIGCLCIARYYLDNTFCWNTFEMQQLVWIFKGPIMITILINFALFVNTIRVLYTKLKAPQCPDSTRTKYRKLARGTFFLVPTFGVYFIIFTIPIDDLGETAEFVMLSIEMFFNSFQGFFIALVLCFINMEVRNEIKRSWDRGKIFKWKKTPRRMSGINSSNISRHESTRRDKVKFVQVPSSDAGHTLSSDDNENELQPLNEDEECTYKDGNEGSVMTTC